MIFSFYYGPSVLTNGRAYCKLGDYFEPDTTIDRYTILAGKELAKLKEVEIYSLED